MPALALAADIAVASEKFADCSVHITNDGLAVVSTVQVSVQQDSTERASAELDLLAVASDTDSVVAVVSGVLNSAI